MANWSNPQLTSTYTNFLAEVKARDDDLAVQFSTGTISNQPDGAIKWDSSANIWKKWSASGSSWGALTSTYYFPALTTTGTAGFGGNITITGTVDASSTVSGTAFIPDGSSVPANGVYLPAANRLGFSTASGHRAALDSTGLKLGSGTASCKLEVDGGIKVNGGVTHGSHGYSFRDMDQDGGMFSPGDNTLTFKTNNLRRVTISGNHFGINVDSPATHLHLKGGGSSATTFRIENSEGSFNLKADGDKAYYYADEHVFSSQAGSGNWTTLNGTGLGINCTPGSYKLDVTGNSRITGDLTVTGTLSGTISGSATNCLNVDIASDSTGNADHYVSFTDSQTGNQRIKSDGDFKYNPSTNTLTVGNLNVSGGGGGIVPVGGIIAFKGTTAPAGWVLCDNSSAAQSAGAPDLRDKFIVGTGGNYSLNATGGSANAIVVSHNHTAHTGYDGSHGHGVTDPGHNHDYAYWYNQEVKHGDATNRRAPRTVNTGQDTGNRTTGISIDSGGSHRHTISTQGSSGTNANLPPYYALAYIMRTS